MFNIRGFTGPDTNQVIALWHRCGLVRETNDPSKDISRKMKVRGDLFLIGLLGEEVVSTVMAGYEGHRGWINYLAVAPEHRKQGYGRRMMSEAEALLRREGCPKINLQVRTSNADVLAFYAALGFLQDDVVSLGKRLEHDDRSA